MMMHPDVQHRAQRELDNVVGRTRLPSFEDKANLPYVQCILKETLRWKAVTPLGELISAKTYRLLSHLDPRRPSLYNWK